MTVKNNALRAIVWAAVALPAIASASADQWLERMNQALHTLDYEGRFVYQHGNTLEAMYLSHKVEHGQERERLISLTGLPREVVRDADGVVCLVAGRVSPDTGRPRDTVQLSPVQPIRPDRLSHYYRFELGDTQRVADRLGQSISILPQDDLRYGYWLLLDQDTGLPLAAATLDAAGNRISQLLFTELQVGPVSRHPPQGLGTHGEITRWVTPAAASDGESNTRWQFRDLPGGFVETRYRRRIMGNDRHAVEHFVFSDGLATVSVYIEQDRDPDFRPGLSRLGAVVALSKEIPGHQVTAVGEVPERTLGRFLDGIQPASGEP